MTAKNLNIIVKDVIGNDSAISTEDGVKLFDRIKKALDNKVVVSLSFKNIDLLTSAFLNASIGQLYAHFDSSFLNTNLKVTEIESSDLEVLKLVIERAKEYFKDQAKVSAILDKEIK